MIAFDTFFHLINGFRFTAKTIDLRKARDAWFHFVSHHVPADELAILFVMSGCMGSRPDE